MMKKLVEIFVKNKFSKEQVRAMLVWARFNKEASAYLDIKASRPVDFEPNNNYLKGYDDTITYIIDSCEEYLKGAIK